MCHQEESEVKDTVIKNSVTFCINKHYSLSTCSFKLTTSKTKLIYVSYCGIHTQKGMYIKT